MGMDDPFTFIKTMTENAHSFYRLCKTSFGLVAVLWSIHQDQPKISRILLSKREVSAKQLVLTSFPDVMLSSCAEIDLIADQIAAFLTGKDVRFSLNIARLDLCSKFQQKVLRAELRIPRGSISTYQRIANHLGIANGARAAGRALATNPFPIIIPCHRAIRSDRTLGGYQGGLQMKRALLEMEGIPFDSSGHVVTENLYY